jgi:hypothetical protein
MRHIEDYCLNAEVTEKRLCAADLLQKQFLLAEEYCSLLENFSSTKGCFDYVRNKSLSSHNICSHSVDILSAVQYSTVQYSTVQFSIVQYSTIPTALYDLKIKWNILVIPGLVTERAVVWFRRGHPQ